MLTGAGSERADALRTRRDSNIGVSGCATGDDVSLISLSATFRKRAYVSICLIVRGGAKHESSCLSHG